MTHSDDREFREKVLVSLERLNENAEGNTKKQERLEESLTNLANKLSEQTQNINNLIASSAKFEEKIVSLEERAYDKIENLEKDSQLKAMEISGMKEVIHSQDKQLAVLQTGYDKLNDIQSDVRELRNTSAEDKIKWSVTGKFADLFAKWAVPTLLGGTLVSGIVYFIQNITGG